MKKANTCVFAFWFDLIKLFASYPCVADVYARKTVVFGILHEKSFNPVGALDDDIVGIIATAKGFVADDSTLVPVDAVV